MKFTINQRTVIGTVIDRGILINISAHLNTKQVYTSSDVVIDSKGLPWLSVSFNFDSGYFV